MKCNYCGGNLSLENAFCPHCGRPNEQAAQHIKDMQHYKGEFEQTKEEVYETTAKFTRVSVRIVIIALLLTASLVLLFLRSNSYSIRRSVLQSRALKNQKENIQMMDQYLEDEDYLGFYAFCDSRYITCYDENVYQKYAPVRQTAMSYSSVYKDILSAAYPTEYDNMEMRISTLTDDLDYFYKSVKSDTYDYIDGAYSETNRQAIDNMSENISQMMVEYLGVSKEDAEQMKNSSNSRRGVIIEEALNHEP